MKEIKKEQFNLAIKNINSIKTRQDYIKIRTIQTKREDKILKKDLKIRDINFLVHHILVTKFYGDFLYMSV